MSISASYSPSFNYGSVNYADGGSQGTKFKQLKQDFSTLSSDLGSGNLSGAQSAFSQLQSDLPTPPSGSAAGSNGQNPIQTDISNLGQALGSGSLSEAQSAYSQLLSDFQNPPSSASGSSTSSTSSSSSTNSTGSSTSTSGQNAFQSLISSLSSALSSNNLTDAQSIFKQLDTLFQKHSNGNAATAAYAQNASAGYSSSSLQVAA